MGKVVQLDVVKHVYELDDCAGCGKSITGEYMELGVPNVDGTEMKHIALCDRCNGIAEDEDVL